MPNVKIYVDEVIFPVHKVALKQSLTALHDTISKTLEVPVAACQFAILPVVAKTDQPAVNVEIHIMSHANRTRETLKAMGMAIQNVLREVTGTPVAFRCVQLDPVAYVTLK